MFFLATLISRLFEFYLYFANVQLLNVFMKI